MLHELLQLNRPLFVVDTETTGTDVNTDRIVEIGFQEWGPSGLVKEWRSYVNPGVPIPPEATAVHHITNEMVKDAYTFRQLAASLAKGFVDCDFGGQHVRFDLRIIQAEMTRALQPWHYGGAKILDSHRLEALAIPRNLSILYEKYTGKKHDGAHGALPDVQASSAVIAGQLATHESLPRSLAALHEMQWPGFIDTEGLFKFVGPDATITFGKWKGKLMRAVPRDYWQWMAGPKAGFSDEIKAIASKAIGGVFPQPPKPKCDGNHGAPACDDPECWQREEPPI